jgi:hypothetical protein
MFDPKELSHLREAVRRQTELDRKLLDDLQSDIKALKPQVRVIRQQQANAVSMVASDGGNNSLVFDPFLFQLVRVVDSYGKQLCLEVISPTTDTGELFQRQFCPKTGEPVTALGKMMRDLEVTSLNALSPMIPRPKADPMTVKAGWVMTYRDVCEWAVLYDCICYSRFGTDTVLVRDGLLRSKVFAGDLFAQVIMRKISGAINRAWEEDKRRIYLVGIAKKTKLQARYQLAMALEEMFVPGEPRYVPISRDLETKNYKWDEYARGMNDRGEDGEVGKFVAGTMFFVRFGRQKGDPIWVADIFEDQEASASDIFGFLLTDSIAGFPVPLYPRCLQQAHEHAQIVDFDLDIMQDTVFESVRELLPVHHRGILDAMQLHSDVSAQRYA